VDIEEIKIKNFTDYVKNISDKRRNNEQLWFRGINNSKHKLVPSILRRNDIKADEGFTSLEKNVINRFRERSIPYVNKELTNDLEVFFFMQHYGVPTRLLDWTENPFVALFFALIDGAKNNRKEYKEDAIVWIVNPIKWNNHLLSDQGHQSGILNIDDSQLNAFKPPADYKIIPIYPVAIYGSYNSTRIVAQRGAFFIFGKQKKTMEAVYKDSFSENCLIKLIIEKDKREKIKKELLDSGITESVVFPDLDGLAKEIKRLHGFEV
jgi:hypothetical protein